MRDPQDPRDPNHPIFRYADMMEAAKREVAEHPDHELQERLMPAFGNFGGKGEDRFLNGLLTICICSATVAVIALIVAVLYGGIR